MRAIQYLYVFTLQMVCLIAVGCGDGSVQSFDSPCQALDEVSSFRIVGGEKCIGTTPVAKLILMDEEDNPSLCSGSLVSSQWVLSAAHCFPEYILGGEVELGGTISKISEIVVHPNVDLTTGMYLNDLALVKLEKPVKIPPILLGESDPKPGDMLSIFGYGISDPSLALDDAGILRGGSMKVTSTSSHHIIAEYQSGDQNICYGDSGGPAFANQSGALVQVGVISTGSVEDCTVTGKSFFTNILNEEIKRFIESTIDGVES